MNVSDLEYTLVFTTLAILLLIAAAVIVIFLASRQRARQETALAEARLAYESELRTIESEVQETTLTHLASELHDNIGQLLTVMRLQVEKEKIRQPLIIPALNPISETLQTTMEQVRLLSHSLSHDLVSDRGLQHSIGQEVQRLNNLERHIIHFYSDGMEPVLSKDTHTIAFRIFQELLSNTIRHAAAANIYISLQGKDSFCLQVRDDGKGFNKEVALQAAEGLGLKNILRRASLAGLECCIDTAPQKGTTFTITSMPQPGS